MVKFVLSFEEKFNFVFYTEELCFTGPNSTLSTIMKVCLTGKDHFTEFCKHSGMVNTKFKKKKFTLYLTSNTYQIFL